MTIFGSLPILNIPVLTGGGLTTLYNKVMQDFESINSMVLSDLLGYARRNFPTFEESNVWRTQARAALDVRNTRESGK